MRFIFSLLCVFSMGTAWGAETSFLGLNTEKVPDDIPLKMVPYIAHVPAINKESVEKYLKQESDLKMATNMDVLKFLVDTENDCYSPICFPGSKLPLIISGDDKIAFLYEAPYQRPGSPAKHLSTLMVWRDLNETEKGNPLVKYLRMEDDTMDNLRIINLTTFALPKPFGEYTFDPIVKRSDDFFTIKMFKLTSLALSKKQTKAFDYFRRMDESEKDALFLDLKACNQS